MPNLFDGRNFVTVADQVMQCQGITPESATRTAIGRYYYGAFLEARDAAGITDRSPGVHTAVIDYYAARNSKLSNHLKDLRRSRNKADYQTERPLPGVEARRCKGLANKVLKELGIM